MKAQATGHAIERSIKECEAGQPPLFNRELSWIEFNSRVLEEGLDRSIPLLERLKFLSIFSTNLDEFFMVRVASLQEQLETNPASLSPDCLTPATQLKLISERLRPLLKLQTDCLLSEILPGLEESGVRLLEYKDLTSSQQQEQERFFFDRVFPVLTPLAVDPGHPFPYISNISLNLGILLGPGESNPENEPRFARVRQERNILRRYVHLGTGNYNPATARIYTDLCLFTCSPAFGADCSELFNVLTGYSGQTDYRKVMVAPARLREQVTALIRRELEHPAAGRPAGIVAKCNSLTDTALIDELYAASAAGVPVTLLIRGVCCLRPGVAGLSENIRVASIVGRFLEHSRVYLFANGGEEEIYLGSADLMHRNLNRRVETLFPLDDPQLRTRLREEVLDNALADNTRIRCLDADGKYHRAPVNGATPHNFQEALIAEISGSRQIVDHISAPAGFRSE